MPEQSTLAVAFGGPSPEHDVSILTGLQAARELHGAGADVVGLLWSKTGEWFQVPPTLEAAAFVEGVPRSAESLRLVVGEDGGFSTPGRMGRAKFLDIDVVVNCCHGGPGEDGSLQGAFDLAGIRYTGPSMAGAALGMDKLAFAGAVTAAGLPTLDRTLLTHDTKDVGFPGPYIVKPRFGGSSIGVEVVADLSTAVARLDANPHLRRGAVVEPFRGDLFDLNVGVRSWPELALSAVEKPLKSGGSSEILGYADKYVGGEGMVSAPRELPAVIDAGLATQLRDAATVLASVADVRGVARIDFLSDGADWFVNEINTVPGSLAKYLWVDPPVPFAKLLGDMVDEARRGSRVRHSATGADGTVLRGAGAIAAKLS
ncbi:MAG: D-alanine--D-alanine ligase family protein [Acidimicrobiales bacterium]